MASGPSFLKHNKTSFFFFGLLTLAFNLCMLDKVQRRIYESFKMRFLSRQGKDEH